MGLNHFVVHSFSQPQVEQLIDILFWGRGKRGQIEVVQEEVERERILQCITR